ALPELADVRQTAPVTQILPTPNLGRDIAQVNLHIRDDEGSPSQPELAYQPPGTTDWSSATIAAINGAAYGSVPTSPEGLVHGVSWDAGRDLGPGYTNIVALRARAHDLTMSGPWSPPVAYEIRNTLANNPRAYPDFATTPQGLPVDIDVLANDTVENLAPKLIASLGIPAHGSAATNPNKTVRYTPAPDFTGADQFIYTLTDGAGAYSIATVTVTVTPGSSLMIVLESPALQAGNQVRMTIRGTPGHVYEVQVSTNLMSWSTVQTITNLAGIVPFTEQVPANATARFYRAMLVSP
ncbi:MAG TPA: Ig-like domain-containing protein, partial [Verrucomicrobiae bacterium]|nr:Ig-like domain-containing protein [Verrucomicrobiae bacterium]